VDKGIDLDEYKKAKEPFFSIIIPVFNRAEVILRVINSCLSQSFADIEVIVIDDGSIDETVNMVRRLTDLRVRLIQHEENKGVCAARNTGARNSRGEWLLLIDSDDEFLPDALSQIFSIARKCPDDIERLAFLYRLDDGTYSPMPVPADCILDYPAYLQWYTTLSPRDFLHCTRRRSFKTVKFTELRAYELSYLLDFSKIYKMRMIPIVVGIIHSDCANRISEKISSSKPIGKVHSISDHRRNVLRSAHDEAIDMNDIISKHGVALKKYAPQIYRISRKMQFMFTLLAGDRWGGSQLAVRYLLTYPWCLQGWVIWLFGLMGKNVLARIRILKVTVIK